MSVVLRSAFSRQPLCTPSHSGGGLVWMGRLVVASMHAMGCLSAQGVPSVRSMRPCLFAMSSLRTRSPPVARGSQDRAASLHRMPCGCVETAGA
jgi:hypothetical protein